MGLVILAVMRRAATSAVLVAGLATLVLPRSARGDRLSVTADGVAGCPQSATIRSDLEARLGRDLFAEIPGPSVTVVFAEDKGRFVATVVIDGDEAHARRFEASRCATVARAVTVFLSVALDARPVASSPHLSPRAEPASSVQLAEDELPGDATVEMSRPARRASLPPTRVGIGVAGHVGLLPAAGTAVAFHASVGARRWTLDVTAQWSPPVTRPLADGQLVASMAAVSAGPCFHGQRLQACALVTGGRLSAHGEGYAMSFETDVPYAAAGGRVAYDLPLGNRVAARVHLDSSGTLTRARLAVAGTPGDEWTAPRAWLGAGVSLVARVW